jgi:predicted MFS family arabinose efflux permease
MISAVYYQVEVRRIRNLMQSLQVDRRPAYGISRALTLLFAVSGGAAVGNLYWAQPLLSEIATSFGVSVGSAGILITGTQLGMHWVFS